ncbi:unnamed protein product [Cuscuta epithymum]|uniref:Uncharacterized protein n=1 Tax=Cuscuta epithymum TaxID=186058 RepID=A0AAV0DR80_9ASTE|nr:unnamed protein product [Cuscuta epithymum]
MQGRDEYISYYYLETSGEGVASAPASPGLVPPLSQVDLLKEVRKEASETLLTDHGVVCSGSLFENSGSEFERSISCGLFQEDLLINGFLSSPDLERRHKDLELVNNQHNWSEEFQRDTIGGTATKDAGQINEEMIVDISNKAEESGCNEGVIFDVIPLQVSFPDQEQNKNIVVIEGASQDVESSEEDESSGYDSDQELLDRLSDPNWKLRSQILPRRSARLQAKILAVTG